MHHKYNNNQNVDFVINVTNTKLTLKISISCCCYLRFYYFVHGVFLLAYPIAFIKPHEYFIFTAGLYPKNKIRIIYAA